MTDRQARRAGQSFDPRWHRILRPADSAPFAARLRVGERPAELRGQRGQERFIGMVEAANFVLTHQQYTLHTGLVDHGYTEKTPVRCVTRLAQKVLIELRRDLFEVECSTAFGNPARQAFAETALELADHLDDSPSVAAITCR